MMMSLESLGDRCREAGRASTSKSNKDGVAPRPEPFRSSSEADLLAVVNQALRSSGYPPLWNVECEMVDGVVFLRGRVSTYYLKQVAQTAVMATEQVETLENRIEVTSCEVRRCDPFGESASA